MTSTRPSYRLSWPRALLRRAVDRRGLSRRARSRVSLQGMLRIATALVLTLIACKGSTTAKKATLQAGDIAFVGASVVPMDREGTLTDQTVVVRGGDIALVAPSGNVDTKGATVI